MMKSFNVKVEISGKEETLLVVPEQLTGEKRYRVIKDGIEICTLKQNGEMGWEVNGTPLNAEELDSLGQQIHDHHG